MGPKWAEVARLLWYDQKAGKIVGEDLENVRVGSSWGHSATFVPGAESHERVFMFGG